MMINSETNNVFALKKDNYISVSVDMSIKQAKKTISTLSKPVVKENIVENKVKNLNIDSLFSDVWTKTIKESKTPPKKINNRLLQEIKKQTKTAKNNEVKSVSDMFKDVNTKEISEESSSESTAFEVNKYLAKIQALVYKYFFPPSNSEGNTVKAVIQLSAIGKVKDFRILSYSSNEALNNECDKIKNRLINIVFPKNPDNNSGSYTISLTSKE